MDTNRNHHYTFHVEAPIGFGLEGMNRAIRAGVEAPTHADGLNLVAEHFPKAATIYLSSIERIGDGCGDERCAVCHPSTRNQGKL